MNSTLWNFVVWAFIFAVSIGAALTGPGWLWVLTLPPLFLSSWKLGASL